MMTYLWHPKGCFPLLSGLQKSNDTMMRHYFYLLGYRLGVSLHDHSTVLSDISGMSLLDKDEQYVLFY